MDSTEIKLITGVRRSGKTYLLKSIIEELKNKGIDKENIIYISFESKKYKNIRTDTQLDELVDKLIQKTTKEYTCYLMRYKKWINGKKVLLHILLIMTVTFM